jgi:hypothetical protein
MDLSLRSVVTAGVTAMTASAIVVAPAVTPLPQHRTVEIALAADVRPVRPLVDDIKSLTTLVHTDQVATQRQALVGGSAAVGALSAGSTVMDIYNAIEPWVQYGFEVATWAVGWVPVVGIFSGQIMVAYFTIEPLVRSVVQSFAYLLDLNIGAIPGTLVNGVVSAATAFVQGEINWVLGFFPPFPPFPPLPFAATALAAPTAALAGPMVGPTALAGPVGNAIVDASHALAGFSHAIWNTWLPIKSVMGNGVAGEGDALVGFANDMISAGDAFVTDTVAGGGLITATDNALSATVNSIGARGGQAVDAAVDFGLDQLNYFTGAWLPPVTQATALQRLSRESSPESVPQALTGALLPLTAAKDVLDTGLTGGADAVEGGGEAPPVVVDKATDRTSIIKAPRQVIQDALEGKVAAATGLVKASGGVPKTAASAGSSATDQLAEGLGAASQSVTKSINKSIDQGAKRVANSLQKAANAIGTAVSGKGKKGDTKDEAKGEAKAGTTGNSL